MKSIDLKQIAWNIAILVVAVVASRWQGCGGPSPPPPPPPPAISLPAEVKGQPGRLVRIEADTTGEQVRWHCVGDADLWPDGGKAVRLVSPKPGRFLLFGWTAIKGQPTEAAKCTVIIGQGPDPDPGPGPGPDPPGPSPIPADGLRVLIVYETAELSRLPPAQSLILYDAGLRAYLNTKCALGPDGKTKEWRIWDKDVDTANVPKLWQDALRRDRKALPWIIVSNPQRGGGFEGPLPATAAETLTLIKRFGGD